LAIIFNFGFVYGLLMAKSKRLHQQVLIFAGLALPALAGAECVHLLGGNRTMNAIGYLTSLPISDPKSLDAFEIPVPKAGPWDLVVRVQAVSVNPVDTKQRKRKASENGEPIVLGYDAAGVVTEMGSAVTGFQVGDEVYYAGDISRPGTNSEFHSVDARLVGQRPKSISVAESASIPLTALTAHEALFEHLRLEKHGAKATVLIIGGAGGVGSMAIQMATLAGARVVTTASRQETIDWVQHLGADVVLDHRLPLQAQLEAHGIREVDAIFNTADTALYWEQMAALIKPFGRICSIVESNEPLNLTLLMAKSASFTWELMFTRSLFQTPDMAHQGAILNEVASWIDEGRIRSTVGLALNPISPENLRKAHAILESGKAIGKVVLSGW
jgi:NADPH:quinone reductase